MLQDKRKAKNRHTDEGSLRRRMEADAALTEARDYGLSCAMRRVHYNPRTGVYYEIRQRSVRDSLPKKKKRNFWDWLLGREDV
jgi:hypothetical protein